jgi:hypothetical protein
VTTFAEPVLTRRGATDPEALLVVLHGRGSDEEQIATLVGHLPRRLAYAAVRAPIAEGGGFAWFATRGIGRPVAESLGRRWPGSGSGSTPKWRVGRWRSSDSAAVPPSPADSSWPTTL